MSKKMKQALTSLTLDALASPAEIAKQRRKTAEDKLQSSVALSILDRVLLDGYHHSKQQALQDYKDLGYDTSSPTYTQCEADYDEAIKILKAKQAKKAGLPTP